MPRLDLDQIARLYADGATIAQLAERFGLTHETMRRRMAEAKIPRRRRGPPVGKYRPADGRIQDKGGYQLIRQPEHANAAGSGYVREQRAVMAELLGRPLADQEVVSFRNGDRRDVRPGNLELHETASAHMSAVLAGNDRALGDEGNPRRRYRRRRTREQMLRDLVALRQVLGREIRRADLIPPAPSWRTLARTFGTWQTAVATAIGSPPRADRPASPGALLADGRLRCPDRHSENRSWQFVGVTRPFQLPQQYPRSSARIRRSQRGQ